MLLAFLVRQGIPKGYLNDDSVFVIFVTAAEEQAFQAEHRAIRFGAITCHRRLIFRQFQRIVVGRENVDQNK